jgi:hypothetical protein
MPTPVPRHRAGRNPKTRAEFSNGTDLLVIALADGGGGMGERRAQFAAGSGRLAFTFRCA